MEFHSVELSYSITDPDNLSIAVLLKSTFKESIFARIRHRNSHHFIFTTTLLLLYQYTQMGISARCLLTICLWSGQLWYSFGCVILQLVCMEYFLVSLNVFVNNSKRYYSVLIQLYHTLSVSLLLETHYFLFPTIVITNGVNNFPHTSLCTSGIF